MIFIENEREKSSVIRVTILKYTIDDFEICTQCFLAVVDSLVLFCSSAVTHEKHEFRLYNLIKLHVSLEDRNHFKNPTEIPPKTVDVLE